VLHVDMSVATRLAHDQGRREQFAVLTARNSTGSPPYLLALRRLAVLMDTDPPVSWLVPTAFSPRLCFTTAPITICHFLVTIVGALWICKCARQQPLHHRHQRWLGHPRSTHPVRCPCHPYGDPWLMVMAHDLIVIIPVYRLLPTSPGGAHDPRCHCRPGPPAPRR
jgi:hypothetical protein